MVSDFGELESLEKDSLYWGRVQDSGSDWSLSLIWAPRFTLFILAGSREAAGARVKCTFSIYGRSLLIRRQDSDTGVSACFCTQSHG